MTKIWLYVYKPAIVFMVLIIVLLFSGCERQAGKLPDFGNVQGTIERKTLFFRFMSLLIKAENDRIRHQRSRLVNLHQQFTDGNRRLGCWIGNGLNNSQQTMTLNFQNPMGRINGSL